MDGNLKQGTTTATSVQFSDYTVVLAAYRTLLTVQLSNPHSTFVVDNSQLTHQIMPIPLATRSNAWVRGRSVPEVAGSNLAEVWISIYRECGVLSGKSLCDG